MTVLKLSLVLLGVICFAVSMRTNMPGARWAGIAFVVAALVLRVVERLRSRL